MSLESINAALAAAKSAAGVSAPAGVSGAVTSHIAPAAPVSMRQLLSQGGSMQVKTYLKVDRVAFLIGKDGALFKEFDVEFRFNEAVPFFGLRYGSSPAKYERSLDRVTNSRNGRAWLDCVSEAQRIDARCRGDYPCVDVPFTVLTDIKGEDGKTVLVSKGEKVGWTASITNYKDFADFARPYYSMMDQGVLSEDALVRGKIKHVKRSGVEDYGALTFVDFTVVDNGSKDAN